MGEEDGVVEKERRVQGDLVEKTHSDCRSKCSSLVNDKTTLWSDRVDEESGDRRSKTLACRSDNAIIVFCIVRRGPMIR